MKRKTILAFIAIELFVLLLLGSQYILSHQSVRLAANATPVTFTSSAEDAINAGFDPAQISATVQSVTLEDSSTPFLLVYKPDGTFVGGSATLGGANPAMPQGVLDFARANGENRVTWQPTKEIRAAIVARYLNVNETEYIIVGGQSLAETDKVTSQLLRYSLLSGVAATVLNVVVCGGAYLMHRVRKPSMPVSEDKPAAAKKPVKKAVKSVKKPTGKPAKVKTEKAKA